MNTIYHDNQRYRMHTISVSVDWDSGNDHYSYRYKDYAGKERTEGTTEELVFTKKTHTLRNKLNKKMTIRRKDKLLTICKLRRNLRRTSIFITNED